VSELPPPPERGPENSRVGAAYPFTPPRNRNDLPPIGINAPGSILLRFAARLIDVFVIGIPLSALVFAKYTEQVGNEFKVNSPDWLIVLTVILPIAYEAIALTLYGRTLGKWACGLRVANYVSGDKLMTHQAAMRVLVPAVPASLSSLFAGTPSTILSLLAIGVYLSSLADPIYRGLHDKAAGTIVLRTR